MESIAVKPDNFETEVLKSDKPALVIMLPIDYGDESDPSDDSIQFFDITLAEFQSEIQKTAGDNYKVALVDRRYEFELNLFVPVPPMYPPPIPFLVLEKGERVKIGFLMGFSKDTIFQSLKQQLSN
ncbi:hypothetical protein [Anabaena sp. UHCC 0399]|uniref:hypothetical protein n=1 Tax=Anabaena sp. UHCC 0399 TaxID=3110238 RepID=UPI002B1EFE9A|nr:hypothetical protein [Anabaena sp. UHCC 0399]MEA5567890.1 hypothetical protein [Anabaena sp. UHCC 0399]